MSYFIYPMAIIGFLSVTLVAIGLYLDITDFDKTQGGYEAPYEGVTGDPVDWYAMDKTPNGIAKRGYVINVLVDGTTGLITFELFGWHIPFRQFSERALVVHKPREAFVAMGFSPEF
ncbi:MAG: hypothetical protein ACRBB0_19150 [Pelagimonas sp.]|uniref:hypothetical protein n=1 Tax=Pelagimonas sp. TaxID=2073170 RepID=UPI003D6A3DFF